MPTPPNLLLIMADQMRFDCLGAINPSIRTPNLDRLCAEGSLFTRGYAPTAVCLPCRSSVLTGQYATTHGATWNHADLDPDHPVLLSRHLRERGYLTHLVGKSHFSNCHDPCSPESAPHIHNLDHFRRWHGPWYGFERADISIGHTVEAHACGMHYGAWLADRGIDRTRYFGNHQYTDFGAWDLPEEHSQSAWVAETTIASIDRARERGQPFFTWSNFGDPHNPCFVPEPWASMYDPARIPTFGFKPGEPACFAEKPAFYREILAQPGAYAARPSDPDLGGAGNVCHLDWDPATTQRLAAHYYGMVSMLDAHLGRVLAHLDATGQADNTLLVFTADHGDLLGDHGLWFKSLVPYDESIRVPFIVRGPGVPRGRRSPALQNLVDLFPTLCAATGTPGDWRTEGQDQWPCWRGAVERVRDDTVIEERPNNGPWVQHTLITDAGWRIVHYAGRDEGELYAPDDVHLIHNRWADPCEASRREALLRRLLSHLASRGRPNPDATERAMWGSSQPRPRYRQLGVIDR